jgi:hypothetical protein
VVAAGTEVTDTHTIDAPAAADSCSMIARLQGQLQFDKTRNQALNFEIARLKRWRFGSSAERLEASTRAVLFEQILADTALEDRAAQQEHKLPAAPPRAKGQAVR